MSCGAAEDIEAPLGFHLMAKPIGPVCNLPCEYCFYLEKEALFPDDEKFRMTDAVFPHIRSWKRSKAGYCLTRSTAVVDSSSNENRSGSRGVRQCEHQREEILMKKMMILLILLLSVASLTFGQEGGEQAAGVTEEPFQVALWSPLAVRPDDVGITIFRFNLIYGRNVYVKGLDLGIANHCTGGVNKAWQIGLINSVEGDFIGWQDGWVVNFTAGKFIGYQSGIYNDAAEAEAFQMGIINKAGKMSGLQLGFVNWCESMYGLQIGFANYIASKETLPFFVFVNWSF